MQQAGTHEIQSLILSDATVWSIQEDTLGAVLHHLDIRVLVQVALDLAKGCHSSTPSE